MIRMRRHRDAPVRAWVETGVKAREPALELCEGFGTATGKAHFLPDFVKPTRIAGVAALQVRGADPQPAGNPDVDRVVLGQGALGDGRRWLDKKRGGHGTPDTGALRPASRGRSQRALDETCDPRLIARKV